MSQVELVEPTGPRIPDPDGLPPRHVPGDRWLLSGPLGFQIQKIGHGLSRSPLTFVICDSLGYVEPFFSRSLREGISEEIPRT